jgi:hypothetical protein
VAAWSNPGPTIVPSSPFTAFESYVKTTYPTYWNFDYGVNTVLSKIATIAVPGISPAQMTSLIADLQLNFPTLF